MVWPLFPTSSRIRVPNRRANANGSSRGTSDPGGISVSRGSRIRSVMAVALAVTLVEEQIGLNHSSGSFRAVAGQADPRLRLISLGRTARLPCGEQAAQNCTGFSGEIGVD